MPSLTFKLESAVREPRLAVPGDATHPEQMERLAQPR